MINSSYFNQTTVYRDDVNKEHRSICIIIKNSSYFIQTAAYRDDVNEEHRSICIKERTHYNQGQITVLRDEARRVQAY